MGVRRKKTCLDLESILLNKIRYAPGMRRTHNDEYALLGTMMGGNAM